MSWAEIAAIMTEKGYPMSAQWARRLASVAIGKLREQLSDLDE